MTVARVTEITATSKKSFDDAMKQGLKRAGDTIAGISSAWIADQQVSIRNGTITEYNVRMKITFVVKAKPKAAAKKKAAARKKK